MPEPAAAVETAPVLAVEDLRVSIHSDEGIVEAVRGVSFDLRPGEVLGIVGESGSGKSVTAMSLIGLSSENANFDLEGSIRFNGEQVLDFDEETLRRMRGEGMAMIFQDPMTSLTPVYKVGELIAETIRAHIDCSRAEAGERAVAMMREVGIPDPERRANAFPHQLSGGMRQRVMIAMALSCEPLVLIADEPTTALDVTIQAQILRLINAPAGRPRHRRRDHLARPRRDRADGRSGRGHVRGQDRRARAGARAVRLAPAPLHLGPAGLGAADVRRRARALRPDSRAAAVAAGNRRGLRVSRALRVRPRPLRGDPAAGATRGPRPPRRLLAPG